jgi:hypothetical protein
VAKGIQNRNMLHLNILRIWNRLTVDKSNERKEFNNNHIVAIKKGNKLITEEHIRKLNPQGATLIGLECVYTLNHGIKTRSQEWGSDAMIKAVMETISYHFKPKLFNCGDKTYDIETIVEMLPKVYKKVLYRKFGCLHGEKSLNVKDDSLLEDYEETADVVDEETGEVLQTHYFITHPLNTYPKGTDNEIHLYRRAVIKDLPVQSGREAVKVLTDMLKYRNSINE